MCASIIVRTTLSREPIVISAVDALFNLTHAIHIQFKLDLAAEGLDKFVPPNLIVSRNYPVNDVSANAISARYSLNAV